MGHQVDDRSEMIGTRTLPLITPDLLLRAYAAGYFPMAERAESPELFWVSPNERGILPLDGLHLSKSLVKTVRSACFDIYVDRDFDAVISACAHTRSDTWINARIRYLYADLFAQGYVHTVECYQDERLVGGLYGLALGGVFFGESMFHLVRDASKVALAHLVARLRQGGFVLLDTQFVTPHLARMGGTTCDKSLYLQWLGQSLERNGNFLVWANQEKDRADQVLEILHAPWDTKPSFLSA